MIRHFQILGLQKGYRIFIANYLGPQKICCYIQILLYQSFKAKRIQRNFQLWDRNNYFVIFKEILLNCVLCTCQETYLPSSRIYQGGGGGGIHKGGSRMCID